MTTCFTARSAFRRAISPGSRNTARRSQPRSRRCSLLKRTESDIDVNSSSTTSIIRTAVAGGPRLRHAAEELRAASACAKDAPPAADHATSATSRRSGSRTSRSCATTPRRQRANAAAHSRRRQDHPRRLCAGSGSASSCSQTRPGSSSRQRRAERVPAEGRRADAGGEGQRRQGASTSHAQRESRPTDGGHGHPPHRPRPCCAARAACCCARFRSSPASRLAVWPPRTHLNLGIVTFRNVPPPVEVARCRRRPARSPKLALHLKAASGACSRASGRRASAASSRPRIGRSRRPRRPAAAAAGIAAADPGRGLDPAVDPDVSVVRTLDDLHHLHRRAVSDPAEHGPRRGMPDPRLVASARSLGAGELAILKEVILPAAAPSIVTGLRSAWAPRGSASSRPR